MRIVHLGLGQFHRAHQAAYVQELNELQGSSWRITGVSMSNTEFRQAAEEGSLAYTLAARAPDGIRANRINIHDRILVAQDEPGAVIDALCDREVFAVTLTITEKGYCLAPDGHLDLTHPAVRRDLSTHGASSCAVGLLARALARRAQLGRPLDVVSCDNLSGNGARLKNAVTKFARAAGLAGVEAFDTLFAFPSTMVDRIAPKVTEAMRFEIAEATGKPEPLPAGTELFCEWVIEDCVTPDSELRDLANVGVRFVPDVAPFEARKLHMLNAAHSYLAYMGLLAGDVMVHEAIRQPDQRAAVENLWDEAEFVLPDQIGGTLSDYRGALLERFAVPAMQHRLDQIAQDGVFKLRERVLPIIVAREQFGRASNHAKAAVASWVAYRLSGGRASDTGVPPELISNDSATAEDYISLLGSGALSVSAQQSISQITKELLVQPEPVMGFEQ